MKIFTAACPHIAFLFQLGTLLLSKFSWASDARVRIRIYGHTFAHILNISMETFCGNIIFIRVSLQRTSTEISVCIKSNSVVTFWILDHPRKVDYISNQISDKKYFHVGVYLKSKMSIEAYLGYHIKKRDYRFYIIVGEVVLEMNE